MAAGKTLTRRGILGNARAMAAILAGCLFTVYAAAQEMTLAAAKKNGAQKLTKEQLAELLPKATFRAEIGSSRRSWLHAADGTLTGDMTSTGTPKGAGGRGGASKSMGMSGGQGSGTWRVTGDGRYCVEIAWSKNTEKWCRVLYRLGDDYFGFKDDTDDSVLDRKLVLEKG
jgi:hypothetical protein